MSLSGLTGLATSTNAAYEMRKGREKQDISDYDLVVQDQPPPPQSQSGVGGYEVPSPAKQFPAVSAPPPPAVAPSQDREGGAQEEAMYEHIPGN